MPGLPLVVPALRRDRIERTVLYRLPAEWLAERREPHSWHVPGAPIRPALSEICVVVVLRAGASRWASRGAAFGPYEGML